MAQPPPCCSVPDSVIDGQDQLYRSNGEKPRCPTPTYVHASRCPAGLRFDPDTVRHCRPGPAVLDGASPRAQCLTALPSAENLTQHLTELRLPLSQRFPTLPSAHLFWDRGHRAVRRSISCRYSPSDRVVLRDRRGL